MNAGRKSQKFRIFKKVEPAEGPKTPTTPKFRGALLLIFLRPDKFAGHNFFKHTAAFLPFNKQLRLFLKDGGKDDP